MIINNPNTYIDFHTHKIRREDNDDILEIVSLHLGKETECDYFTVGKHPWWTNSLLNSSEKEQLNKLLSLKKCLAVGEIGLDKLKGENLNIQKNILRELLQIATEQQKPVIIHCVRAFDSLIKIKREFPEIKKWCIHGFSRHSTLAKQLINERFYLSIMPVKKISPKYTELIKSLPINSFFLETDSMPNTKIEDIYLQVANIREISVEELKVQLIKNFNDFFKV
ncbi:MAG: TatD family hydrolase [Tenacibaculum sp.]|nr:TatD family hydrolase [Tenacibaculum sp.]